MIYHRHAKCSIQLNESLKAVILKLEGFISMEEYQLFHETALKLLSEKGFYHWIGDFKNAEIISLDNRIWMKTCFFPMAQKARLREMAVILAQSHITNWTLKTMIKESHADIPVNYFSQMDEVIGWFNKTAVPCPAQESLD